MYLTSFNAYHSPLVRFRSNYMQACFRPSVLRLKHPHTPTHTQLTFLHEGCGMDSFYSPDSWSCLKANFYNWARQFRWFTFVSSLVSDYLRARLVPQRASQETRTFYGAASITLHSCIFQALLPSPEWTSVMKGNLHTMQISIHICVSPFFPVARTLLEISPVENFLITRVHIPHSTHWMDFYYFRRIC